MSNYTFGTHLQGEFAEIVDRVTDALAAEGFGVLTTIDVQSTFRAKLGIERDPYVILGACNPPLAARAIEADARIGALLPCNVVVRETGEGVAVDVMDPNAVLELVDRPEVDELASEVRTRLVRAMTQLTG